MKKTAKSCIALLLACMSQASFADAYIEAVPNGWRIQRYVSAEVTLWYTGSSCAQGMLKITSSNADAANQLWSLLLTARSMQKTVGIYYDPSTSNCWITSFYLKE